MFNGQPPYEACVARFEAALGQEAPKVRSRRSAQRKLVKLDQQPPLKLGAKMSDILEEPKMDLSVNQYNSHSPGYGWLQNPKTIWHGFVTLLPLRGSLGRKPGRATQAKVRANEKKEKNRIKRKMQRMKKR